jgi:hypothetical protein
MIKKKKKIFTFAPLYNLFVYIRQNYKNFPKSIKNQLKIITNNKYNLNKI